MSNISSGIPTNQAALSAKRLENGGEFAGILQPKHKVAFIANVAVAAGANPTKAEYDVAVAALNGLKAAMVTLGLMRAS